MLINLYLKKKLINKDAQTALDLAILKMKKGEEFGRLTSVDMVNLLSNSTKMYNLIPPEVRSAVIASDEALKRFVCFIFIVIFAVGT
jgi:hypothetical protein